MTERQRARRHLEDPQRKHEGIRLHRDWRLWVGVALMLAAIGGYVASLDDTVVPGEPDAGAQVAP